MFANLKTGSQVYLLHKAQPELVIEMGTVETTTAPQMQGYGMFPGMVTYPIDINVRVGTQLVPFKGLLPNMEVAEVKGQTSGDATVIATSREAVNAEIGKLKQVSVSALGMVEFHQRRIASCDSVHAQLNPEEAQKAQQQAEMEQMRQQMEQMQKQMSEQAEINKQLLAQLRGEGASSSVKRKEQKNDSNN